MITGIFSALIGALSFSAGLIYLFAAIVVVKYDNEDAIIRLSSFAGLFLYFSALNFVLFLQGFYERDVTHKRKI